MSQFAQNKYWGLVNIATMIILQHQCKYAVTMAAPMAVNAQFNRNCSTEGNGSFNFALKDDEEKEAGDRPNTKATPLQPRRGRRHR